jgi:hypothetical protein
MDPVMQQFLAGQMQLFQNMSNRMANMQDQMNEMNQNQPPRDNHRKFTSHDPPTFSHVVDPLKADDWLKAIEKILTITWCIDRDTSYMLHDDFRDLLLIGGTPIQVPMQTHLASPGQSLRLISVHTTFQPV